MDAVRNAVAEFVATFVVVLIAAGATITGGFGLDTTGIALAYGFATAVGIVLAHHHRGQANPAITVALWVGGRISSARTVLIVVSQTAGAVAAGLLVRYVNPGTAFAAASGGTPVVASGTAIGKAIVIEAVATFVIVLVYLTTVADARGRRGDVGALFVGIAVAAFALVFLPYTGLAVNPARWFGPALASGSWADPEVWLVGPFAGGIIASVAAASLGREDEPATP
jgi:glycerol uptake facilitator-like aquaporin